MHNLPTTLPAWLALLESRHAETHIDMGLDRVRAVKERMQLAFACPVIMVAGTNGKGSTCAMLEAVLLQSGYRVGLYIKPHFLDFNERARINGDMATDEALVAAFDFVEKSRAETDLTYFEFTTLAIMHLISKAGVDVAILEVGLGGRLDAVNVIDADVSIVTSIDIDHKDYLGDTREEIGFEKAGIFRPGKPAICSDPVPPQSLIEHADTIGADLWLLGRDFNYQGDQQQWAFAGRSQRRNSLAYPALRGANQLLNASAALAALEALRMRLPVGAQEVRAGLAMVELPGRFQVLAGRPTTVLDVAHNPHAAAALAQNLGNMGFHRFTYAVFGIMQDKDIEAVIEHVAPLVDHWCLTALPSPRTADVQELAALVASKKPAGVKPDEFSVKTFADPAAAFADATSRAGQDDRIVVFGSFYTVAGVMAARKSSLH
ncbi:MAG: bifunctional tetrahydrofolate synthase/dihydrofolate synthase [Oxalobacteraceae bacterium]|nr:MAG: bifunctional tetrahydrofolate synthase/dihydrofolate synthase [Oxalobacteraceae bacterium]